VIAPAQQPPLIGRQLSVGDEGGVQRTDDRVGRGGMEHDNYAVLTVVPPMLDPRSSEFESLVVQMAKKLPQHSAGVDARGRAGAVDRLGVRPGWAPVAALGGQLAGLPTPALVVSTVKPRSPHWQAAMPRMSI